MDDGKDEGAEEATHELKRCILILILRIFSNFES